MALTYRRFLISDLHLGDKQILKPQRNGEAPIRKFPSVNEHDEYIVSCWNQTVKPKDSVYVLGDVTIQRSRLKTLSRLNGRKKLILGNHDTFSSKEYLEYFDDLYGVLPGSHFVQKYPFVMTHIPISLNNVLRWGHNVHGRLHEKVMNNACYINVCIEQVNYTPIDFDEVVARIEESKKKVELWSA